MDRAMTHKAMRSTRGTGRPGTRLWRPPPTRATNRVQGSCMAGNCAHCSNWAMARVFSCGWEGFRAAQATIKLPLIAFPAGVNAEGACPVQGPSAG